MLSHPIIADAIETEFVPLLIVNNLAGRDAELLAHFEEPAWNFQVVRFLDAEGSDILPRRDRVWAIETLVPRMVAALTEAGRPIPPYLTTLLPPSGELAEAAFAMHCFWTGERLLGQIEGVRRTEAGWIGKREVTKVWLDRNVTDFPTLVAAAKACGCAELVYSDTAADRETVGDLPSDSLKGYRPARASDQRRQLSGSPLAELTLNPMQATKANALFRTAPNAALMWLSPSQRPSLPPKP